MQFMRQCVKPKCTQDRWMDIQVDTKLHCLILQEYTNPIQMEGETKHISLPADFKEKIINPVCIALKDDICIIQYFTNSVKFVRFFLVHLSTMKMQMFEEAEHYIDKDIASISPVECLISPNKSKVIFHIPQPILSQRKWDKILSASLVESEGFMYRITNVQGVQPRHRSNRAVAFDPRYPNRLTHVLLDDYCCKCSIVIYELNTQEEVTQKTQTLMKISSACENSSGSDSDSSSEWDCYSYRFLSDCHADYSHNGDTFALCCLMKNETLVRLFLFDSNTLYLIRSTEKKLKKLKTNFYVSRKHMFVPIFSAGDKEVTVWHLEKHYPPRKLDIFCRVPLLGTPSLQSVCRTVIREVCGVKQSLNKLHLPPKLLSFLQFKHELL